MLLNYILVKSDFYHAKISGKPVTEVITDTAWLQNEFIPIVQKRGAAVIETRGASSAASAANAAIDSVYSLCHDTAKGDWFSVCRCSSGEYGVDDGLIFSYPCRVDNGKLQVVDGLTQNEYGAAKFQATLQELRAEKLAVQELGLIK